MERTRRGALPSPVFPLSLPACHICRPTPAVPPLHSCAPALPLPPPRLTRAAPRPVLPRPAPPPRPAPGDDSAVDEMMWRQYGDEWAEDPDLAAAWGITLDFKADFERGFQVGGRGGQAYRTTGRSPSPQQAS